jgi:transcriptional regulator with XRE-family HTH domain
MASLSNYLRINRKRLTLSQEEVAFLLGVNGMDKGVKVSRDENNARVPSLEVALAYEAIYGKPVRELFAGIYEQVEQQVAQRAKVLSYSKPGQSKPKRQQVIANLFSKLGVQTTPHEPTA